LRNWRLDSVFIRESVSLVLHFDMRGASLYPALHRLERRGWIKASWGSSENNRRAKYYELTRRGRARLEVEISAWRKLSDVVPQVLESA
jgi:DNA-binding PadR family transcriptional regulator